MLPEASLKHEFPSVNHSFWVSSCKPSLLSPYPSRLYILTIACCILRGKQHFISIIIIIRRSWDVNTVLYYELIIEKIVQHIMYRSRSSPFLWESALCDQMGTHKNGVKYMAGLQTNCVRDLIKVAAASSAPERTPFCVYACPK